MNIYGIVGWKNTGKTGLVVRLVAHFTQMGLKVSTLKHAHHSFEVDHEGRDSYRHREAGAGEVLVASGARIALMRELSGAPEPPMTELLAMMAPCDLVLVEGYKREAHPKVETHRAEAGKSLIAPEDASIRAVASDTAHPGLKVPVLDLNDTGAVADFILGELGMAGR